MLDEALALGPPTEIMRGAAVAAARAEAAWLEGRRDAVVEATSAAVERALEKGSRWALGELLSWRQRAGVRDEMPTGLAAPFVAQLEGDWRKASELWGELGCPYESALALGDADEEEALRRGLDRLQALGARPAADIVARRLRERGARGLPRGPRAATRSTQATSPRGSSRCWGSSARGCEMPMSPSACSSRRGRSITTCRQSFESWASARV